MNELVKFAAIVAVAEALTVGTAAAHHSASMFDQTKSVTLTGTVVEVRWTNPHGTILI